MGTDRDSADPLDDRFARGRRDLPDDLRGVRPPFLRILFLHARTGIDELVRPAGFADDDSIFSQDHGLDIGRATVHSEQVIFDFVHILIPLNHVSISSTLIM